MTENANTAVVVEERPLILKSTPVNRPQLEHNSSKESITAHEDYLSNSSNPSRPLSTASDAQLLDAIRKYSTPPSSPSNPDRLDNNTPEEELTTNTPAVTSTYQTSSSPETRMRASSAQQPGTPPNVRFNGHHIKRKPVNSSSSGSSEESPRRMSYPPPRTSINRSPPSPDADDAPYIRFALDQLTRDEEVRGSRRYPGQDRWSTAPTYGDPGVERSRPNKPMAPSPAYYTPYPPKSPPRTYQVLPGTQARGDGPYYDPLVTQPTRAPRPAENTFATAAPIVATAALPAATRIRDNAPPPEPLPADGQSTTVPPVQPAPARNLVVETQPDVLVPYDQDVPSLRFLPGILRPVMLSVFILLNILMLAGLIFSGVWSLKHNGLFAYTQFGGARYFVFQYLPTLLGMILLIWLLQVQVAVQRVAPYIAMASWDSISRSEGPLMEVQPTGFLLPKLFYFRARQPIVGFVMIIFWLQMFTIPLLGALFNAYYHEHTMTRGWRWTTVQGVVWTLVVLYALLVVALILLGTWLWRQRTGLKWDPRSLADLIALLDRSNITKDYDGSEAFFSSRDFRIALEVRSDRLGYWTTSRKPNNVFYGIGEEGAATRRYSLENGRLKEKEPVEGVSGFYPDTPTTAFPPVVDLDDPDEFDQLRYRYIPWYLRTTFVLLWIIAGVILFLAFVIVSFVNDATLQGFRPLLPVKATASGFSATNFLYSFIPATIGQIIFLSWLSVDYAYRRLQPYAAMADLTTPGAKATESLLLDYPSRLPLSVTFAALTGRDAHVAWFSFLSLLVACIPIFAGGCFWAQWYAPAQQVRVAVHPAAYYPLCVFLAIFAFSLPLILIGLRSRRLPHACTTIAEQTSFLYGSHILGEREWRAPLGSKTEMTGRLMAAATPRERAMDAGHFVFGRFFGRDGRTHMGIDRVGRENVGRTRSWRSSEKTALTTPPPIALPTPKLRRTPSGQLVPAERKATESFGTRYPYDEDKEIGTVPGGVRRVVTGERFPDLGAGATVIGGAAVAGTAAAYPAYDYGSKQDLLSESQKAEYVRRKEGGVYGSPPQTYDFAATSSSAAPPILEPVSPIVDEHEAVRPDTGETGRSIPNGSDENLLAESAKAARVRQRYSAGSRPVSSAYSPPYSARESALAAGFVAAGTAGAAATTAGTTTTAVEQPPATTSGIPVRSPSGRVNGSATAQAAAAAPPLPAMTETAAITTTAAGPTTRSRTNSSSNLPAVPPTAAQVYPYGSAYGSMRDLTASEQAEHVRRREGGSLSRRGPTAPRPGTSGTDGSLDLGEDLGPGLREASAGSWSRDVIDTFDTR